MSMFQQRDALELKEGVVSMVENVAKVLPI
jgi:hypothetical protein